MKFIGVKNLVRKHIAHLKPYASARDEFEGNAQIFLDANENPYPSPYNRYPDPHQRKLKQAISTLEGVNENQIFLGNGSDEAIDLLIRVFCEPGIDQVLIPQPTYGMFSVSADINNVMVKTVYLTPDFDIDLAQTESAWNEKTKLLFLCSPNNPSGNSLDPEKVKRLIEKFQGLVIMDEAYIDFAGYPGFVPLLKTYTNLVILQTLSKAWGLAGLRLGMCFGDPEVIAILNKIKPPYNINSNTQSAALECLSHNDRKDRWVKEIISERQRLGSLLSNVSVVEKVYPSQANFLLVKVKNARTVYDKLVGRGIILRDRSTVALCEGCLRITIGTDFENNMLLEELIKI